jgi:hypothetical protein
MLLLHSVAFLHKGAMRVMAFMARDYAEAFRLARAALAAEAA